MKKHLLSALVQVGRAVKLDRGLSISSAVAEDI